MGVFQKIFHSFALGKPEEVTVPTRREFPIDVVGESFYGKSFAKICMGKIPEDGVNIVELCRVIPEDDNEHDENAVRVELRGLKVGHLSRDSAKRYRKKYGTHVAECYASLTGGFVLEDGGRANYSVSLEFEL